MITELQNFRQKYPDYNNLDDTTLAAKLAEKYPDAYSDLPEKVKAEKPVSQPEDSSTSAGERVPSGAKAFASAFPAASTDGVMTPMSWVDVAVEGLKNIPSSAYKTAEGIVQPVIHPIDTAKGLYNAAMTEEGREAVANFFKERYGGIENLKQTIATDPVGFGADLSALVSGGGLALRAAGTAGKVSGVARAGELADTVAKAVDPIALGIEGAKKAGGLAVKGGSQLAKETMGALTGAGKGAVEEALRGRETFTKAMRGQLSGEEIVSNAKDALQILRENRATAYQDKLAAVSQNALPIDMTPIKNRLDNLMERFNVKVKPQHEMRETGLLYSNGQPIKERVKVGERLETSRIAMGEAGRKDIEDIIQTVKEWGSKEGDNTALGLDVLKRQLDDFYSDSSQARAFVAALRNEVADTIKTAVPEYAEMTKGYSKATALIKDIESNLMLRKEGMSGRITADQTLRRLTSALRENFDMRRDLLNALGSEAGADIPGQVAGYAMAQVIPRGFLGKAASLSGVYYLSPKMWPILAASSPRVAGEFLQVFGKIRRITQPVRNVTGKMAAEIANPARGLYQVGRVGNVVLEEESE